ncbi:outer membrane lipoprotein BfpB-like [Hippocampus zosterae]|uniref:outer membrane lipoprotein BfpB-like n=1 Tax=Hippocampus zosterae TaxID=109293 RepID=UPI00223DE9C9|nr:outer membrane lipoprotein BfpB-like [Hippocampus zosterae]
MVDRFRNYGRGLIVTTAALVFLAGCESIEQADADIGRITVSAEEKAAALRNAQRANVIEEPAPYYGEAVARPVVSVNRGSALPRKLQSSSGVALRISQPSGINRIAKSIQDATGLPVRIRRRYVGEDNLVEDIPIDGTMTVDHKGPLSDLLDAVASRFDLHWSFDGRSIRLDRMQTATYPISLPVAAGNFQSTVGASLSGGSSGGARSVSLSSSAEQDPWSELMELMGQVAPAPSRFIASRDSGRLTVVAPPSVQATVKAIIDDFEKSFSARIGLEIALFFVDTSLTDDYALGLDFNLAFDDAAFSITGGAGATLGGPAVGSIQILSPASLAGTALDIRALSRSRAVVDYQFFSDVTQSGVVAPFVRSRTQNFVSNVTTSTNDSSTQTGIETDTIDTGVFVYALPRLIGDDRIHLTTTIMQSDLVALDSFQSGDGTVQLPQIDERVTQKSIVLSPGETLILSGYEQESAERRDDGVGQSDFFGLGGARFGDTSRTRLIVMVRPSIIPSASRTLKVAAAQ